MTEMDVWLRRVESADLIDVPALATEPTLRVVLYGPYNAGKSSLIKRVLTEWGADASGIEVDSTPTTFNVSEHQGRVTFVDTPGTGNENPMHTERARAEAIDSDLLLVAMTSQLMSGSGEDLWNVLSGNAWGVNLSAVDPIWTRLVVGRFDEAGGDPINDQDGYAELSDLKRDELLETLQSRMPATMEIVLHVVAADPGGLVGTDNPESIDGYDAESWDGIERLRADLEASVREMPQLRLRRRVRLTALSIDVERVQSAALTQTAELEVARLRADLAAIEGFRTRVDRSVRRSQVELEERLDRTVGESVAAIKGAASSDSYRQRVMEEIDSWADGFVSQTRALLAEMPTSIALTADVPEIVADAPRDTSTSAAGHALGWAKVLNDNFTQVKSAAASIRNLIESGDKLTKIQSILEPDALDAVNQIVALALSVGGDTVIGKTEAEQLTNLRRRLQQAAREAGERSVKPFLQWKDDVDSKMASTIDLLRASVADAEATVEETSAKLAQATELLLAYPGGQDPQDFPGGR